MSDFDNPDSQKSGVGYFVLRELDRVSKEIDALKRVVSSDIGDIRDRIEDFRRTEIAPMQTDLALLKFQAAMWGFAAGSGVSLIIAVLARFIVK